MLLGVYVNCFVLWLINVNWLRLGLFLNIIKLILFKLRLMLIVVSIWDVILLFCGVVKGVVVLFENIFIDFFESSE